MKTQTKKWLSKFLAFLMLVVMVCADTGVMAKAAAKNEITKVAIKNMPKGGVLRLEDGSYNFNETIVKQNPKRKTTGLVYWEIKKAVNTAGVQSSRYGFVYPVSAGEFEIRAVAFRSQSELNKWLTARRANGNVEDPAAGKKYVTAYSDWAKITVTSDTEGLGIARTQYQLNLALKKKSVKDVRIQTDAARTFEINQKSYLTKNLIIDAPNAEVNNRGRFASITIEQIKESTFHEFAWGNRFNIKAPKARLVVEKGATVKNVTYTPEQKEATQAFQFNVELFGTVQTVNIAPVVVQTESVTLVLPVITITRADANAKVNDVVVSSTSEVKIAGEGEKEVPVTVEEGAKGTKLNAEVPVKAELNADTEVTLEKDAAGSEVTIAKAGVETSIAGDAEDVVVKVEKEAEGAVIKTETKVEIQAEAKVKVELGEGSEGTSIVAEDMSLVDIKNDTKEEVVVKDTAGNVTGTVGSGETAVVTTVPTPAPTSAPSTPSGGGSSSGGGGGTTTPSTPTPTPTAIPAFDGKVSYVVGDGEKKDITFADDKTAKVTLAKGTTGKVVVSTDASEELYGVTVTYDPEGAEASSGATITATVVVTAKDNEKNAVTYTVTFTVQKDDEVTAAFDGKVSYVVGNGEKKDITFADDKTAKVTLAKGTTGKIVVSTDASEELYKVTVTYDPEGAEASSGATITATVVVTAKDNEKNAVTYTVTFTVQKDDEVTAAFNGKVSYVVGDGQKEDIKFTDDKTAEVTLPEGTTGKIVVSTDASEELYNVTVTYKPAAAEGAEGPEATAGATITATVVVTAMDNPKNAVTYTVTFIVPESKKEVVITVANAVLEVVSGSAVVVSGTAVTTSGSAITENKQVTKDDVSVQCADDTVTVKLALRGLADGQTVSELTGTLKFELTVKAMQGDEDVTSKTTVGWTVNGTTAEVKITEKGTFILETNLAQLLEKDSTIAIKASVVSEQSSASVE